MAQIEFNIRREIRSHIEASARKQNIRLDQHTIENLVNRRIQEIGKEMATGQPAGFIDWDGIVKRAHDKEIQGALECAMLGVQPRFPGDE